MENKDLMELLVDVNHIMYDFCAEHENCKHCILKTNKGTLCIGEQYYKMLKEINENYKKEKEGK